MLVLTLGCLQLCFPRKSPSHNYGLNNIFRESIMKTSNKMTSAALDVDSVVLTPVYRSLRETKL